MKVKLQLPPAIEAETEVVAPDTREDLGVFVTCGDGSAWKMQFRWTTHLDRGGDGATVPTLVLQSLVPIAPPRNGQFATMLPKLPEGRE